jgi:hypothetical protein
MTCGRQSLPRVLRAILLAVFFGTGLGASPAVAGNAPIEAFYGTYEGKASSDEKRDSSVRDISVSIQPHDRGFTVGWSTTKAGGNVKSYSIDFETTRRPEIYGSAMRRNKFGDSVPLDPLDGDPYVWARITGRTLTVYALIITPEGSYEMQVYHRTLSEKGLDLEFYRYLEGKPVRLIKGTLVKVGD